MGARADLPRPDRRRPRLRASACCSSAAPRDAAGRRRRGAVRSVDAAGAPDRRRRTRGVRSRRRRASTTWSVLEPELEEIDEVDEEAGGVVVERATTLPRPAGARRRASARRCARRACAAAPGSTDDTWDELEEALLRADVGVGVTDALLDDLQGAGEGKEITEPDQLLDALQAGHEGPAGRARPRAAPRRRAGRLAERLALRRASTASARRPRSARSGAQQAADGQQVVMAAGDTFRAAAAEQLGTWAERGRRRLRAGQRGRRPERGDLRRACSAAAARGYDLVLGDTAGRLHTKTNLMEELRKVRRVADREPGRVSEVLLVIDATTGQNGLAQARQFARGHRRHRGGAHQARRLGQGRHRVRDPDRPRHPGQARRPGRGHRRPGPLRPRRVRRRPVRLIRRHPPRRAADRRRSPAFVSASRALGGR